MTGEPVLKRKNSVGHIKINYLSVPIILLLNRNSIGKKSFYSIFSLDFAYYKCRNDNPVSTVKCGSGHEEEMRHKGGQYNLHLNINGSIIC